MAIINKNQNSSKNSLLFGIKNALLRAAMADQPAMMTASGWRQNEKGDYVQDQQNDPGVVALRNALAIEGLGVMGEMIGLPAIHGLYNLGLRGLGKAGNNWARAKVISKEITTNFQNAELGDLLPQSMLGQNLTKSLTLPEYAHPNTPKSLAEYIHQMRLKRGFSKIPSVDSAGNIKLGNTLYKRDNFNIEYIDFYENMEQYLNELFPRLKELNPTVPDEMIYDYIINKLYKTNKAFAPASEGKVFTTKRLLDPDNLPIINSHEVEHAIHIPVRPAEGFDFDYLRKMAEDATEPEYFIRNNNTELSARGTQLKNYFGLTRPDQEITEDMLRYAAQNYVKDTGFNNDMTGFFNSIIDWKKAAKWLSESATAYTGISLLNNKNND